MFINFLKKIISKNYFNLIIKFYFILKQIKSEKKLQNLTFFIFLFKNFFFSKSQINQELIIFFLLKRESKRKGYFIEIGACDGVLLSNTYILEKKFKYKGLLCEPSKNYIKNLKRNRKAKIETNVILDKTGRTVSFMETKIPELSTIESRNFQDIHSVIRKPINKYLRKTLSLNDLFSKHNVPKIVDIMSVDTEGSEYEILKNFNFKKYNIKIIICEHNFNKNRQKIYKLLKKNGYIRKYSKISFFDDWYIKKQ
jgi:FkbM family methyltransferase